MIAGSASEPVVPLAWLLAFYASRYLYFLRQRRTTIAASLAYKKAVESRFGGFKTSAQVQSEAEEFTRKELESLRVYLRRNRKVCVSRLHVHASHSATGRRSLLPPRFQAFFLAVLQSVSQHTQPTAAVAVCERLCTSSTGKGETMCGISSVGARTFDLTH